MAGPKDVIIQQLRTGQSFFERFTSDLSEAEYFKTPVEGGNHAAWIIGHVACSEDSITSQITGAPAHLPDSLQALFKNGSTCLADPTKYPTRHKIDEMFLNSRAWTLEEMARFDDSKWDHPSPPSWEKGPFPTLGALWGLQGTHQFWHIGQLTVCRQALRKKRVL